MFPHPGMLEYTRGLSGRASKKDVNPASSGNKGFGTTIGPLKDSSKLPRHAGGRLRSKVQGKVTRMMRGGLKCKHIHKWFALKQTRLDTNLHTVCVDFFDMF